MNLIIFGPQGSGKGTQARLVAEKYHLTNISSGKLLREESLLNTPKGKIVADILKTGELVPFDTALEVLEPVMVQATHGFILDGTPRDIKQTEYLESYLAERNIKIDKVILLDIPREVSLERLAKRAEIENRTDDTPEGIAERLDIYEHQTLPVIEHYRKQGKLIEIDGTPDIQTIFADIVGNLNKG